MHAVLTSVCLQNNAIHAKHVKSKHVVDESLQRLMMQEQKREALLENERKANVGRTPAVIQTKNEEEEDDEAIGSVGVSNTMAKLGSATGASSCIKLPRLIVCYWV